MYILVKLRHVGVIESHFAEIVYFTDSNSTRNMRISHKNSMIIFLCRPISFHMHKQANCAPNCFNSRIYTHTKDTILHAYSTACCAQCKLHGANVWTLRKSVANPCSGVFTVWPQKTCITSKQKKACTKTKNKAVSSHFQKYFKCIKIIKCVHTAQTRYKEHNTQVLHNFVLGKIPVLYE